MSRGVKKLEELRNSESEKITNRWILLQKEQKP